MDLDIKTASFELNRMYNAHQKFFRNVDNYTITKERIELIEYMEAVHTFGSIDKHLTNLSRSNNLSPKILYEEAKSIGKFQIFRACSGIKSEVLLKFRRFFSTDENKLPKNDEITKTLSKFVQEAKSLMECLDGSELMIQSSENLDLSLIHKQNQMVKGSIQFAFDLHLSLINAGKLQEKMIEVAKSLQKKQTIWWSESRNDHLEKTMNQLNNAVASYGDHLRDSDYSIPQSLNTAGFRDAHDIMNVFDDLKSSWFERKLH
uniref:Uncharacterized protein n=1 Tax=Caenorhabditis tropicalis TaxID=1561998 RepID=A0A1I7SXM6_9PELO